MINEFISELNNRLSNLSDVQNEIELIFEDETQLLQDINEAAEFREKAISVRVAATERLHALSKLSEN